MSHYSTLGVPPDAAPEAIKAAYRSLAQAHRPDKHPDDPDATAVFQRIQKAYETLGDPEKRAHYDQTGEEMRAGPTFKDRVMQAVSDIMDEAIGNCDPVHDDILADAERRLVQCMDKMRAQRAGLTKNREKLAKVIARTKARDGNVDQLSMVLQFLDNKLADPLKRIDASLEEGEMAVQILRDHEYQVDAMPVPSVNDYFLYDGTNGFRRF